MSDLNNTTITGRLVRAPLLRNGRNGKLVAFFTIAANQRYQDKSGNRQEETAFVSCKTFGGWAESLSNCQKGDQLLLAGRLRTETWERDGTHRSELILVCDSVFRAAKNSDTSGGEPPETGPNQAAASVEAKDEIPF
jgi:single-strand DNA-binding protein